VKSTARKNVRAHPRNSARKVGGIRLGHCASLALNDREIRWLNGTAGLPLFRAATLGLSILSASGISGPHAAGARVDAVGEDIEDINAGISACEHLRIDAESALGERQIHTHGAVVRHPAHCAIERAAADDAVGKRDLIGIDRGTEILERAQNHTEAEDRRALRLQSVADTEQRRARTIRGQLSARASTPSS
jgi:hypothetical protein